MTGVAAQGAGLAAAALEALPFGVWIHDAAGRLAFANAALRDLVGVGPEALPPGTTFQDAVRLLAHRGVLGPGDPEAEWHLRLDRTRPLSRLLRRGDGAAHELRSVPLPGGGVCCLLRDVSDDLAATAAAEAWSRRLETVLGHLRGGVALYDSQRRLVFGNAGYEELLGLPHGSARPGSTQDGLLRLLAERGEFGNADPEGVVADRAALDHSRPHAWQRERPSGEVLRFESRPMPEGGFLLELTDITALKRAEDEARRRASLLDGVLAALPHGVLVFGRDGRAAMVNAAYDAMMAGAPVAVGEHRGEIARRRALAGEYGPGDPEALARANLPSPTGPAAPRRRVRPNGTVLDIRYAPLPDGGLVQVTTDITALHEAEAQARERAALLGVMLDNMRHGIALFDAGRRLVTANALAARLMGLPPALVAAGRTLDALIADQAAAGEFGQEDHAAEIAASALSRDRAGPFSYTRHRPDGTVIEVVSDPTPDGGFVCTYSDVTARARAEAEARERAATLQATLDNLRHGIIVYGPDRRVRAANRLAGEIAGHRPGAVRPGRTLEEVVGEMVPAGALEPGEEAEAIVRRILSTDRGRPASYVRRARGGRVIEVHSDPLPDGGFVVSHIDVTRLARAEAEATRRAAVLQATLDSVRHGIAMYGPDRRLVAANRLAGPDYGLPPRLEGRAGERFEDLVREQLASGIFGPGEAAERIAAEVIATDRSRPLRYQRRLPNGRVLEIESDPTPDGGFVVTHSDVTGLVQAQAEASRRAGMLQAMLDNMRHGIALFDAGERLVAANGLAAELTGLGSVESMLGRELDELRLRQFAAGEMTEAQVEAGRRLDRSRPSRRLRTRPDGAVVEVVSEPTPDGGFVVTYTDVTAFTRLESEARRRAGILQVMLDNIRHGICYYGPDRRVIAVNALAADLGGHTPGFLATGRSLEELIAQQIEVGSLGGDARAVAGMALRMDRSRPHRYVRPHSDGRIVEVTSDPTPDGGFVVTMSDISALAQAEAEAERRAAIQQVMLDNIRHAILLVDAAGRVVAANSVFRQLLGLPEEVVAPGRPFTDFVDWLEARGEYGPGEAGRKAAAAIRAGDRRRSIRTVRTRPDGTVLDVVSDPTPDGGFVLTFTDVTEDRRVRAELERAKDAAEEANRAKSRFLASMSHELRTPLNAVIGFSEALMAGPPAEAGAEYLRSVHEAGRHLLSLIDDILDVTRADTTGFSVAEGEVDLAELAAGAVRVMAAAAAAGGLTIRADLAPGLPAVRGDGLRLRQVLLNLLSNAVKFTPPGGSVTLSLALDGVGGLALRVADTGIGIRPEDIPRAFDAFNQLDGSLSRRFPGSGLGLYLSRALAVAQGAELALESAPGQGTTAVLRFPGERLVAPAAA